METITREEQQEQYMRDRTAERIMPTPKFRTGDKVKFIPEYQDFWPVEQRYDQRTLDCRGMVGIVQEDSIAPFVTFDGKVCVVDQDDLSLMGRKS